MANGWTPERRARQAELIRQWRPWEKSTGPKTEAGKAGRVPERLQGRHLADAARAVACPAGAEPAAGRMIASGAILLADSSLWQYIGIIV